jgi:5-methylcytosine-specific restriction endonuclease McrA
VAKSSGQEGDVLRRVENVSVYYYRDLRGRVSGKYKILIEHGRKQHYSTHRITADEFNAMAAQSVLTPVAYLTVGERTFWRFNGRWHTDSDDLTQQAVHALLVSRAVRQADQINRAGSVAAMTQSPVPTQRTGIPREVKQRVWHRDGGACRWCGSNAEVQFDHVIPVALGGSNAEDNLQILCAACNRRKGASVG